MCYGAISYGGKIGSIRVLAEQHAYTAIVYTLLCELHSGISMLYHEASKIVRGWTDRSRLTVLHTRLTVSECITSMTQTPPIFS